MGVENWTLMHLGLSVKNMDEAVKYFKSLGAKADDSPAHVLDSANFKDFKTYGKTGAPPWKIKIKMVNLGPLSLELTEPIEGGNWNETFMDEHGEGPNHFAFMVDNLEKEVAEMEAKGVPIMYYAKGQYSYVDARKVGGLVIELFQKREMPPGGMPPRRE
jgi:catechol 2,3-dioxygenase-like lactoylglutathione lyase family enzyme